jgi:hypothetical protein
MKRRSWIIGVLIISVSLFYGCAGLEVCKTPKPVQTEYTVKSPAGPTIYVVRKAPSSYKPTKVVLLIPWVKSGSTLYNLPVEGYNLMDYLVSKGFVTYAVDHRSYGKSTKTQGLDVNADNCGKDMKAVADFIEEKEKVDKVNVVGLSLWNRDFAITCCKLSRRSGTYGINGASLQNSQ